MDPTRDAAQHGAMLMGALITLLGMAGAALGVLAASGPSRMQKIVPLGAGLLLGMAVFVVFPEALAAGGWAMIAGSSVAGCATFAVAERLFDRTRPSAESLPRRRSPYFSSLPLLIALSLHAMLDGWNVGIASQFTDRKLVFAFLLGMGIHKCTGGAAAGAILRAALPSTVRSLSAAALVEALTFLGVMAELVLSSVLGERWTAWLLAATGGSFLYLAFHSLRHARQLTRPSATAGYASLGFGAIWLVSLVKR